MAEIDTLLAAAGVTGDVSVVGANPLEPGTPGDVHYQATLRRDGRAVEIYCSTAAGRPAPSLAQAMLAAGRRAHAIEGAGLRSTWARTLALDAEASELERRYEAQRSEANALRALLGDDRFSDLVRSSAGTTSSGASDHRLADGPMPHDAIGYPARSDEMTFQEPLLIADEDGRQAPRSWRAAGAMLTAGAVAGVALGIVTGRALRRRSIAGVAVGGSVLGLAAAALAVRWLHRHDGAPDADDSLE
ncbi:MAG: hypothetical protein O2843_05035, partial [Chloroflexi bacterium]|nr:hypothetical protein [Chloroflexota bacterium]